MTETGLKKSGSFSSLLKSHESGLLFAILIVVVMTSILDTNHNYIHNFRISFINITRQTSLLGIFSIGAAIVIISGGIDLSSGSVIAFSGTICATLMLVMAPDAVTQSKPIGTAVISLAIAGTLLVGFMIGSLHAWLITVVKIPPFVATLATLVGLRSFGRAIVESVTESVIGGRSSQIQINDESFRYLASSVWIPAVLFLLLAFAGWVFLSKTVMGRHLYAIGGNEEAARLSGIRTGQMKWLAYCISAMLSSIAGILYIADQSVADPETLGMGYELNAIAAAVVGGCSLQGGIGTIPGTVLGALFLRVVMDGIAKVIKTGATVYEGLIVGVVVVLAVTLSQFDSTGGKRSNFKGSLGVITLLNLSILAGSIAALMGPTLLENQISLDASYLGGIVGLMSLALLVLGSFSMNRKKKFILSSLLLGLSVVVVIGLDKSLPQIRYNSAISAVEKSSGIIEDVEDGLRVDFSGSKLSEEELKPVLNKMAYLSNLVELNLKDTKITNQSVKTIGKIKSLRRVNLKKTEMNSSGIRKLKRSIRKIEITQ